MAAKYNPLRIPLSSYLPSRKPFIHKIPRKALLFDPAIRYPIYNRLPKHWRDVYEEKIPLVHQDINIGSKRPQHGGLWSLDLRDPKPVTTVPIEVFYPKECRQGLWGGEGEIRGLKYGQGNKMNSRNHRVWRPMLKHNYPVYSEILDQTFHTVVTKRALDLIDDAYGLDFYILQTSWKTLLDFGSFLKRDMLSALDDKDNKMYTGDLDKRNRIYEKYCSYKIDSAQIPWIGLSLREAMKKQWEMEKENGTHEPTPLLEIYTKQLEDQLREENQPIQSSEATIFNKETSQVSS